MTARHISIIIAMCIMGRAQIHIRFDNPGRKAHSIANPVLRTSPNKHIKLKILRLHNAAFEQKPNL